jgi:hypothetical protein
MAEPGLGSHHGSSDPRWCGYLLSTPAVAGEVPQADVECVHHLRPVGVVGDALAQELRLHRAPERRIGQRRRRPQGPVSRQECFNVRGPVSQAQLAEQVDEAVDGGLHGAALLSAPRATQALALLGGQHLKDAVAGLQVQLEHLAMRYRHRVVGAPFCGLIQGCSLRR